MSNNFSLDAEGNFAPIGVEHTLFDLPVTGALPAGLNGTLFRNGPNPQFAPLDPARHHWFEGDGMVHAFALNNDRASYRNRWVRTDKWMAEHEAGHAVVSGFNGPSSPGVRVADTGVANTNIVWHAGRLLALEEGHLPFEMDPVTLATHGVRDYAGMLEGPFTAHPKLDPVTGELVFFGYSTSGRLTPGMTYGTIGADGKVDRFERFDAPYSSMVHDFAVTRRHVLFPILPLCGSVMRAQSGQNPYAWQPELGSYIGLLRRDLGVASLRWFQIENGYVFHVLNAWDDGARIVADVMQYREPPLVPRADGKPSDPSATRARLVRWTLDPNGGEATFRCTELDDMTGEFPRLDERRAGLPNRFGLFAAHGRGADLDTIVWLDLLAGTRATFTLPAGDAVSEAVFAPRAPDAEEGDGWLLAVAWRGAERRSDLIILDTHDIRRGPVATVRLPHRVPFGFHGNWVGSKS